MNSGADDWQPPPGAHTLDGVFHLLARAPGDDLAAPRALLRVLFQHDYWRYFRLVQSAIWELDGENEEYALRWRRGRLQDAGFPDPEDAARVYSHLREEQLTRLPVMGGGGARDGGAGADSADGDGGAADADGDDAGGDGGAGGDARVDGAGVTGDDGGGDGGHGRADADGDGVGAGGDGADGAGANRALSAAGGADGHTGAGGDDGGGGVSAGDGHAGDGDDAADAGDGENRALLPSSGGWLPELVEGAHPSYALFRALRELAAPERARVRGAFLELANRVALADAAALGEVETLLRVLEKAARLASLGLTHLARENRVAPADALRRASPERLFQIGHNLEKRAKAAARD